MESSKALRTAPGHGVTEESAAATTVVRRGKHRSILRRFLRNRRAAAGLVLVLVFVLSAAFAPLLAHYKPDQQVIAEMLRAPSLAHIMGTDHLGRDVFSRVLYAGRVSLPLGFLAMAVAMGVGVTFGTLAGFVGGYVDNVLMRFTDLVLCFPTFFLLLTVAALFGTGFASLALILGLTSWGSTSRLVRSQVLSLREEVYVQAARSVGASNLRIIVRHLLPNAVPIMAVDATLRVAMVIIMEGGLSFLGLGIQPPTASWGNMIAAGRDYLRVAWWITVFPGAALFLCVIAFNMVGEGLSDAFNPRLMDRT